MRRINLGDPGVAPGESRLALRGGQSSRALRARDQAGRCRGWHSLCRRLPRRSRRGESSLAAHFPSMLPHPVTFLRPNRSCRLAASVLARATTLLGLTVTAVCGWRSLPAAEVKLPEGLGPYVAPA